MPSMYNGVLRCRGLLLGKESRLRKRGEFFKEIMKRMQKLKKLSALVAAILGIVVVMFLKGRDETSQREEKQPEYGYISELISVRDEAGGTPGGALLLGEMIEIEERREGWALVKGEGHRGWIEEKAITDQMVEDHVITTMKRDEAGELKAVDVREAYSLGELQFYPIKREEYAENPRRENRAVYISLSRMGRLDEYIELARKTDINTFVLDIKDDKGRTLFRSERVKEVLGEAYIRERYRDVSEVMAKLKENDIYVIGRISTFKDEALAGVMEEETIRDRRSGKTYLSGDRIPWLSPYQREVWEYNVELAKEAADHGFNEINFDYVRFPSGVRRLEAKELLDYKNDYNETKPEAIQRFLKYARDELSRKKVYVNASVFGQAGLSLSDENIGQYWEGIANVVDVISPMAYPSHYAPGTLGIKNPDKEPYKLMERYAERVRERNANLIQSADTNVWIQGFSAPWLREYRVYKGQELRAQIEALRKNEMGNYQVWNAASRYYWDGFKEEKTGLISKR